MDVAGLGDFSGNGYPDLGVLVQTSATNFTVAIVEGGTSRLRPSQVLTTAAPDSFTGFSAAGFVFPLGALASAGNVDDFLFDYLDRGRLVREESKDAKLLKSKLALNEVRPNSSLIDLSSQHDGFRIFGNKEARTNPSASWKGDFVTNLAISNDRNLNNDIQVILSSPDDDQPGTTLKRWR